MDAFYASVEQRDFPELRGLPIVVGFDGSHGVVSAASYEARKYGVRSAMPIEQAKRHCPELRIVDLRMDVYKEVSSEIHQIFHEYTDLVEPLALDEAFLDVTKNKKGISLAVNIAREIKERIFKQTKLTASVGVSYNKFLAKVASDMRKPNGIFVVHPLRATQFLEELNVGRFWGVGAKTALIMHKMGIFKGKQLKAISREHLVQVFGKMGLVYYDFVRGIDERPVEPARIRKSVGCEETFMKDLHSETQIILELYHIVLRLTERLAAKNFEGRTLTLKVKWDATTQITRSRTTDKILRLKKDILPLAKELWREAKVKGKGVRLLGLTVSLAKEANDDRKRNSLEDALFDFLELD